MLEVVYRVPIVIDNGQEKSHKKMTSSINIATNQIYIAIIALLIEMGFLLLISYNYTVCSFDWEYALCKISNNIGCTGIAFL